MKPRRLRAPAADGALLAEPALSGAPAVLAANAERLDGWDHDFQGRRASWLRPTARRQVLERARAYLSDAGLDAPEIGDVGRLVVTGHQPELFHPGVWIKNFAAATVARQSGAGALNLVVDNDVPRSSSIRVPRRVDDDLRVERVRFDDQAGETPHEDLVVADESLFATFGDRARSVLAGAVDDPILDEFWPRARRFGALTRRLGLRFALARRAVEASWGVNNFEVPLSAVCETEGFLWFASHLLAHLPRFQEIHNDALTTYRAVHGIRSRRHPVPALGRQGDWLEAPFWAWRAGAPRRRPLMARQLRKTLELRIGGDDQPLLEIPLAPDREACCAVEQLRALPALGVRLRTRALTTTMFARSVLGDLFLHGIGGAKYDELGDAISTRFFQVRPPEYLTLSLTLWLGLDDVPDAPGRLQTVDRALRDLAYNPDRRLDAAPASAAARLIDAKRRAIAGPMETHAQRLERFQEIRRCNAGLQDLVADRRAALLAERPRLVADVRRQAVARSREYALVLHSRSRLRAALERALPGLELNGR